MKKVIGIFGVVLVVIALFFNTNNLNITTAIDINLATLLSINSANAEDGDGKCDKCVVKNEGSVVYSCKTLQGESCKKKHNGVTLSCANAKEC